MNEFFAVIISFNPNHNRIKETIKNLRGQGFDIIIVDNGSRNPPIENQEDYELVLLNDNMGVAKALNIGMEKSKQKGAKWVLSLDQDTIVDKNILSEYKKHINLPRIGALCPRIERVDEKKNEIRSNKDIEEVFRCPTAGFFMSIDSWEKAGKYDEWLFIDYVDYDLCIRIINCGLNIYRINSTYIIQELGELSISPFFYWLGNALNCNKLVSFSHVYNHSPKRNYYYVRNSNYYLRKYRLFIDVKEERNRIIRWEIKKILLESHKLKTIKSIIYGIRDSRERRE